MWSMSQRRPPIARAEGKPWVSDGWAGARQVTAESHGSGAGTLAGHLRRLIYPVWSVSC